MSPDVFEVAQFSDITPRDLMKYGIVRVLGSQSIITSDLLSEEALNPNYIPIFDNSRRDASFAFDGISISTRSLNQASEETRNDTTDNFVKIEKFFRNTEDKRRNKFTEIDYSEVKYTREVGNYVPISGCYMNDKSATKSSFNQGWTISVGSGASASVQFSQLFGFSPAFGVDFNFGYSVGGSLSCDVAAGKVLQFQAKVEQVSISNLRQRRFEIKRDYKYTAGIFATMEPGPWETIPTYSQLNKFNVQLACVTDPAFMICGSEN